MKKTAFGLLVILSIALFSCLDDDGYSINDQWIAFGMVQDNAGVMLIKLDDGNILRPVAWGSGLNNGADLENGERLLVNFTVLDDVEESDGTISQYLVKINAASDVLMKGILEINEENADSIGNDPIIVDEYWMTDSLLNFKLKYWGYNEIHFLNLVQQEVTTGEEPFALELRHNANDDETALQYTAFVSFSLNQLRVAGQDSVSFTITSTDYEGETHSFSDVFNYSDLPLPGAITQE